MAGRLRKTAQKLRSQVTGSFNARVRRHLGCEQPHTLSRSFPEWRSKDAAVAMWGFLGQLGAEVMRFGGDAAELLADDQLHPDPAGSAPILEQLETEQGDIHQGLRQGLALLTHAGAPLLVQCWTDLRVTRQFQVFVAATCLEAAERFMEALASFELEHCLFATELRQKLRDSLNTMVREHLGERDGRSPELVTRSYPAYQIPSVSILMKEFLEGLGATITGRTYRADPTELLEEPRITEGGGFAGYERTTPQFSRVPLRLGESRDGLDSGLALVRWEGEPLLVGCHKNDSYDPEYEVVVVTWRHDLAGGFLDAFERYERDHSVFRGRLIRPQIDYKNRIEEAEILDHVPLDWSSVVLPIQLRRALEEDVIDYVRQAPVLAANGLELKRGILFHGPPGTGKSYVCRLLASVLEGFTGIVVAGENLYRAAGAFALARKLAPALLFFEDVDLVAGDRESNHTREVLGTLLNELDGLARSEQVLCVFTTNHLDYLEDALAHRPGRVDLVLEFPLPEADLRRRLIQLYAGKATLADVDLDRLVADTDGVTPAFIRELMKQAVFQAARAGANGEGIALSNDHVQAALTSLRTRCGDPRLERILGFRALTPTHDGRGGTRDL